MGPISQQSRKPRLQVSTGTCYAPGPEGKEAKSSTGQSGIWTCASWMPAQFSTEGVAKFRIYIHLPFCWLLTLPVSRQIHQRSRYGPVELAKCRVACTAGGTGFLPTVGLILYLDSNYVATLSQLPNSGHCNSPSNEWTCLRTLYRNTLDLEKTLSPAP